MDSETFSRKLEAFKIRAREKAIAANNIRRIKALAKREGSSLGAINRVKEVAVKDCWCSNHADCFRFSVDSETIDHILAKFEEYLINRLEGRTVFTECRLNGLNNSIVRPDVLVCGTNGDIEIIEIVQSESNENIEKKENKYPFKMRVVKCN